KFGLATMMIRYIALYSRYGENFDMFLLMFYYVHHHYILELFLNNWKILLSLIVSLLAHFVMFLMHITKIKKLLIPKVYLFHMGARSSEPAAEDNIQMASGEISF
ncbi:hypothetical protein ACJX0J_019568, partial [Zea mays]